MSMCGFVEERIPQLSSTRRDRLGIDLSTLVDLPSSNPVLATDSGGQHFVDRLWQDVAQGALRTAVLLMHVQDVIERLPPKQGMNTCANTSFVSSGTSESLRCALDQLKPLIACPPHPLLVCHSLIQPNGFPPTYRDLEWRDKSRPRYSVNQTRHDTLASFFHPE